ncbi:MAG: hypothetical protein ACRC35_03540 [Angustibacter sp.]
MNPILAVIVACEIGFWVFVVLGLLARYVLRRRRAGAVLLACTPGVDLALLIAVVINLQGGGTATFAHGLAALYLGVSIAYGHKMIKWADARFAHRFAHGPAPVKLYGPEHTKERWTDLARTTLATGITAGILWLLTGLVGDSDSTQALTDIYPLLGIWYLIDLTWAISYTVRPRKRPRDIEAPHQIPELSGSERRGPRP